MHGVRFCILHILFFRRLEEPCKHRHLHVSRRFCQFYVGFVQGTCFTFKACVSIHGLYTASMPFRTGTGWWSFFCLSDASCAQIWRAITLSDFLNIVTVIALNNFLGGSAECESGFETLYIFLGFSDRLLLFLYAPVRMWFSTWPACIYLLKLFPTVDGKTGRILFWVLIRFCEGFGRICWKVLGHFWKDPGWFFEEI